MSEIKTCPYCDGKAFVRKLYTNYIVDAVHEENCPLSILLIPHDSPWCTKEAAIAAWNKRQSKASKLCCANCAFFSTNGNLFSKSTDAKTLTNGICDHFHVCVNEDGYCNNGVWAKRS